MTPDMVLEFWFGEPAHDDEAFKLKARRWFMGGDAFDREIAERFGALHAQALRGELDAWADTARGRLALVIVLDQFSRNLHRGSARAFAQDKKARQLVVDALDRGLDAELSLEHRMFLQLPLGHAENLELQNRAVAYVERLTAEAPAALRGMWQINLDQAREHRDTVARFGRFPQRNAALSRTTTGEEMEFLEEWKRKQAPV
jgi:uncharacterized protein (DUF924 family)